MRDGRIRWRRALKVLGGNAALSALLWCGAASAKPDAAPDSEAVASDGTQDIVVTATRRSERLQDIPLSVTAVSNDRLDLAGANTAVDALALVPAVSISQQANSTLVTIRGVGLDTNNGYGESNVAQYIDGVYQPRSSSINLVFADLDRVEVLRGPQGTLYGRNATGGALNFISRQPTDEFEAGLELEAGSYRSRKAKGFLSGALTPGLSVRASGFFDDFDGYGRNVTIGTRIGGNRSFGARFILRAELGSKLTATATGYYVKEKGTAPGLVLYTKGGVGNHIAENGAGDNFLASISPYRFGGGTVVRERFKVASWMDPFNKGQQALGALTLEWEPADDISFKSISAVQSNKTYFSFDAFNAALADPFPLIPFISDQGSKALSQELTSNLELFDDRLSMVVGGYLFKETFKGDNLFNLYGLGGAGAPPNIPLAGFVERTSSRALFVDGTLRVTDRLKLLFGARSTWEKKDVDQRVDQNGVCAAPRFSLKYSNFSPKAGIQYDFDQNIMAYFTYQKGFKAGGFGAYVCNNTFQPEKITSYEGGIKTSLFDRMLTLSASAFHYDYTNLQVLFQVGTSNIIDNAATSKIDGGEVEFSLRPSNGFQLDGNVSVLDARYASFFTGDPLGLMPGQVDLSGNRLLRSPKFGGQLGVQQVVDIGIGELLLRGEVRHTSKIYFGAFNRPGEAQSGVTVFNAYASVEVEGGWTLRGFVKNITDKTIITNASIVGSSASVFAGADPLNPNFPVAVAYGAPRTWGIGLSKRF